MRLVLVHGFTQTGGSWKPIVDLLAGRGDPPTGREDPPTRPDIVCPDAPGHGTAAGTAATVPEAATMLSHHGPAVWIGYSMGGRICLQLALDHPDAVDGLVLVSTTPGIEDPTERAARRADDEGLADGIDDVPTFIERWLSGPLWRTLPRESAGVEYRVNNTAQGLASSLRLAGTGAQEPLWGRLHEIAVPVLIVTGTMDPKFTAIGARMAGAIAKASTRQIEAGHAVPWEQPAAFVDAAKGWLDAERLTQRTPRSSAAPQPGAAGAPSPRAPE